MKTLSQIKKEIAALTEEAISLETVVSASARKRAKQCKKELTFLKMCKLYLESKPSKSFLKSEQTRITNRINLILDGKSILTKKQLREYEKLMNVPKLRTQIKTIYFLLDGQV